MKIVLNTNSKQIAAAKTADAVRKLMSEGHTLSNALREIGKRGRMPKSFLRAIRRNPKPPSGLEIFERVESPSLHAKERRKTTREKPEKIKPEKFTHKDLASWQGNLDNPRVIAEINSHLATGSRFSIRYTLTHSISSKGPLEGKLSLVKIDDKGSHALHINGVSRGLLSDVTDLYILRLE